MTTLGSACEVIAGQSPEGSHYNHDGVGEPFYQGKKEFGDRYVGAATTWTTRVTKQAKSGDIVMSVRAPVGPVNILRSSACIGRGLAAIRPQSGVDRDFIFYQLQAMQSQIAGTEGAVFASINKGQIEALPIWLPSLAEQQRIVAKIDDVEAEMLRLGEVTKRSREASRDLFHRFVEDRLAELYSSHPVRRIGDVLAVARGGSPRPIAAFLTSSSDGVNWVKISDATASRKYIYQTAEKIKPEGVSRSRLVTSGDFLLSNSMSFGRPYIMRTTGCIHDGWLVLSDSEKQFDEDYLFQVFSSRRLYSEFSKRAQGSTVSNLNSALVSDVSIPVPPIEVQKAFAAQAGEIEAGVNRLAEITTIKASKLKDLRAAVLETAFRGDL